MILRRDYWVFTFFAFVWLILKDAERTFVDASTKEVNREIETLLDLIQIMEARQEKLEEELIESKIMYANLRKELSDTNSKLYTMQKKQKFERIHDDGMRVVFSNIDTKRNASNDRGDDRKSLENEDYFDILKTTMYYGEKLMDFSWNLIFRSSQSKRYNDSYPGNGDSLSYILTNKEYMLGFANVIFALLCVDFLLSKFLTWWLNKPKVTKKRSVPVDVVSFERDAPCGISLLREANGIKGTYSWQSGSGSNKNLRALSSKSWRSENKSIHE